MKPEKETVLRDMSLGRRVAEEEIDELSAYFVETDQWRKVLDGEVDVIFGPKGAGKSAIYSTLLGRYDALFDEGIVLVSAENPKGTPAFRDLVSDPPTSETEFVSLWKLYILSLVGSVLTEEHLDSTAAREVKGALAREGLLPAGQAPLRTRVALVLEFVRKILPRRIEGEVKFDAATGAPIGVGGGITLGEPTSDQRTEGVRSIDALLALSGDALREANVTVWLLFDRLDVAFAESRELEANALRALFKCYLDLLSSDNIRLKIFLRSDIWRAITTGGFREASHITRQLVIRWSSPSLLNLVVRRLLNNAELCAFASADPVVILANARSQREFFDRLVPDQVDAGKNPKSFEWILGRVEDGLGNRAPREVIHLLNEARDAQLAMLERGEEEPPGDELFSRQALREALLPVSRVRLEQTIFAENPELQEFITALEEEKAEQTPETLAQIWGVPVDRARSLAVRLVEIGVFDGSLGSKSQPRYWIPFLYRPALRSVQGAAAPRPPGRRATRALRPAGPSVAPPVPPFSPPPPRPSRPDDRS